MKKWLALIGLVVALSLTASASATTQYNPLPPLLVASPGDLIRLAGTPKVCAVNRAIPRGRFMPRVAVVSCWNVTESGSPAPNGRVLFILGWEGSAWNTGTERSLVGHTSWNATASKFNRPAPGAVFSLDMGWPLKYKGDPFAVTEDQRLGRKAKILRLNQSFAVPFSAWWAVGCGFDPPFSDGTPATLGCSIVTSPGQSHGLPRPLDGDEYQFVAWAPWDDSRAGITLATKERFIFVAGGYPVWE